MTTPERKPYLIIPFLIEQPTWGGEYICEKKGWKEKTELKGKRIGQSYELYSKSLLAMSISSTKDREFSTQTKGTLPVSIFMEDKPFPLIKFTQAKGNSFQLHIPQGTKDSFWHPKAESWYFFEDGKMTFGIKKGINIDQYKKTCLSIDAEMKRLSKEIEKKEISKEQAEEKAQIFIRNENPWQFVNEYNAKKGDIVDLSSGGVHHSWEEDKYNPRGNIVFEVQQDEMDPISTIRSFDQGKFLKDGTIRDLQIEDYFKYLDTSEEKNTLKTQQNNTLLFNTPFYTLKIIKETKKIEMKAERSFHHYFVKQGSVALSSENGELWVDQGHSCFIPKGASYSIEASKNSELLQTSIE